MKTLPAPFPYFGGKRKVAQLVWQHFGDVKNYVEPFFGSGAVLLGRPTNPKIETVNDFDGLLANFWRALKSDPDKVAHYADWPVSECDLHARHAWLVWRKESLQAKLEGDPDFYDPMAAGWWVWGICCWIGSGFCSGKGPWMVRDRQLVHLGDAGRGIHRQLVHLGDAGQGIHRHRKRVHMGNAALSNYFYCLADRLQDVRVCCGDWSRVCGPSVTHKHGLTAVFLDPPYADTAGRANGLYRPRFYLHRARSPRLGYRKRQQSSNENCALRLRIRAQDAAELEVLGLERWRRLRRPAQKRREPKREKRTDLV